MGWRFPAGLQVFHDTVCHANKFFLHLKKLASRIAMKILRGQLSSERINLAQEICRGLVACVQDHWFNQIWKGRNKGSAVCVFGFQSKQKYVAAEC